MKAFLNAAGDVLITAQVKTLAQMQAVDATITQEVLNAARGLLAKLSPSNLRFHKKTSGDGSLITHYTLIDKPELLADNKRIKDLAIDVRSQAIIAEGFVHSTKTFSLSERAQINWLGRDANKNSIIWPYEISTIDEQAYSVANQAELQTMIDVHFTTKDAPLISGAALKASVAAATTQAELDAIIDTR